MKRFFPLFLLAALLAGGAAPAVHAQAATARPKIPLAFVTNNASDYWTICRKGAEAAARDRGDVRLQFVEPADGTAAAQMSEVNALLARRVRGIAISPVDPVNETAYLNGVAARTSLITSDADAPASRRLCYIGTDNRAAGAMAGRLLRRALPRGGSVMLFVGRSDAQNARERIAGIRDAVRGSRVRILGVRTDDTDRGKNKQNALDTLARYPHLAGMVGLWSYNGGQIASAVTQTHKVGRVVIIAFDQEQDTMDGVRDGTIYGTVVQDPYQFGYQSIALLARLARGDRSGIPAGKRIIVPTRVITRANARAYLADYNRKKAGG